MKNPFRIYEKFVGKNDCLVFNYFYMKILDLYCNRFIWKNLPPYIPPDFLEKTLFYRANAVFIYDKNADAFAVMKSNLTGIPDIYNIPDIREAYAVQGYLKDYTKENSVIIWDNHSRLPFYYTAVMYAQTLANAWATRDINMYTQRTPFVIKSNSQQRLTYANIGNEYDCLVPVIKVDDTVDLKNLDVLKLDSPWLVSNINIFINDTWSQVLTDLGYESNPVNKKERVISQEVNGNNGETEAQRNVGLDMRNRACDAINKLWGLNMSVEFNSKMPTSLNGFSPEDGVTNKGGEQREPLDNAGYGDS